MKTIVKRWMNRSRILQYAYAAGCSWAGRTQLRKGRPYRALGYYCQGWRHVATPAIAASNFEATQELIRTNCYEGGALTPINANRLLQDYVSLPEVQHLKHVWDATPYEDRIRLRYSRQNPDPTREGNLIILKKPNAQSGEKGVLLLKYNESFEQLPAVFNLGALAKIYSIVLEPSTTNYIEPYFFLYLGSDTTVVVQCTQDGDAQFIRQIGGNLRTVRLGGGDWVDFDLFRPAPVGERPYDLVMVASWARMKRHDVLFKALERLRPDRFKVALVGTPYEGRTVTDIRLDVRQHGLEDQCEVFNCVPPAQVASLLAQSKAALLLSRFEGSNKGLYEALFCNTPVIVYRHHIGLNMSHVNESTGVLADDDELPETIRWMVKNHAGFRPREWAIAHTGYKRSTEILNEALRDSAEERAELWTYDIVPKVNRPNLKYKHEADRAAFSAAYEGLAPYLRG